MKARGWRRDRIASPGIRPSFASFLLVALAWLGTLWWPATALAHGGGTLRLSNAAVGPYLLSIWSQPDVLRVGEIHLTLAVAEPAAEGSLEAGAPILDANVQIVARPVDGGQAIMVSASRDDAANKLFYEADFEVEQTGPWLYEVRVTGPLGGGTASFEVDVLPAASVNLPLVAGGAVILAVAVWLIQGRRKAVHEAASTNPAYSRRNR